MTTEAVARQEPQTLTRFSMTEVLEWVKAVKETMETVMKKDEHYGTIPGTSKPTLYKPGAEKLGLTFRFAPRYIGADDPRDLGAGHREFIIRCDLHHIHTGAFMGSGVGSCSTLEAKYRYRDSYEDTGHPVPKKYWDDRDQSLLGGKEFRAKKVDGQYRIVKVVEHQENTDIADTYNTVLKMAKKRAHVDAVLTATAASDIFTQDVEDTVPDEGGNKKDGQDEQKAQPPKGRPPKQTPTAPNPDAWKDSFAGQVQTLMSSLDQDGVAWASVLGDFGFESTAQVPSREKALQLFKIYQERLDQGDSTAKKQEGA